MSGPIKVGDLVRVIRAHDCDPYRGYGTIFTVAKIAPARNLWCNTCGAVYASDGRPLAYGTIADGAGWHPVEWLRRIPPLHELEDERPEDEVTA